MNGEAPLMEGAKVGLAVPETHEEVVNFYKQTWSPRDGSPVWPRSRAPWGVLELKKGARRITLKATGDRQKSIVNVGVLTQ